MTTTTLKPGSYMKSADFLLALRKSGRFDLAKSLEELAVTSDEFTDTQKLKVFVHPQVFREMECEVVTHLITE